MNNMPKERNYKLLHTLFYGPILILGLYGNTKQSIASPLSDLNLVRAHVLAAEQAMGAMNAATGQLATALASGNQAAVDSARAASAALVRDMSKNLALARRVSDGITDNWVKRMAWDVIEGAPLQNSEKLLLMLQRHSVLLSQWY